MGHIIGKNKNECNIKIEGDILVTESSSSVSKNRGNVDIESEDLNCAPSQSHINSEILRQS